MSVNSVLKYLPSFETSFDIGFCPLLKSDILWREKYLDKPKTARPGNKPSHNRFKMADKYSVNARIWIEKDGELYLGGGRIMLLERISATGSIAAAARSMKLTYRNAWLWIESMNRLAPSPLVEKVVGGVKGGRTRVTTAGEAAITRYRGLSEKLNFLVSEANREV